MKWEDLTDKQQEYAVDLMHAARSTLKVSLHAGDTFDRWQEVWEAAVNFLDSSRNKFKVSK